MPIEFEQLGFLQIAVGIRADRKQHDHARSVGKQHLAQQSQERLRFVLALGAKQFFALIDGDDRDGWVGLGVGVGTLLDSFIDENLQQRPERARFAFPHRSKIHRAICRGREHGFQRGNQTGLTRHYGASRPNDRQRQEMPVVARQPRQQAGTHERRFAGARRAEDDQQSRRRRFAQTAQPVECFENRRVAAEENAGVLGFKGTQPPIRRVDPDRCRAAMQKTADRAPP